MTRQDEIQEQLAFLQLHGEVSSFKDFIKGVEWADKELRDKGYPTDKDGNFPTYKNLHDMLMEVFIAKASDWLRDNVSEYLESDTEYWDGASGCSITYKINIKNIVKDFIKDMRE